MVSEDPNCYEGSVMTTSQPVGLEGDPILKLMSKIVRRLIDD